MSRISRRSWHATGDGLFGKPLLVIIQLMHVSVVVLPQIENTSVQPSLLSGETGIAWPATADLVGEVSSAKAIMQTVTGSKSSRAEDSCSHSPNPLGCMQVMVRVRAGLPNEYWFLRLLEWLSPMVIHY